MKLLSLFAGIGGIDLAAQWAGIETVAFCENDPYATQVLKKRFPGVPVYGDIRTVTAERLWKDGIWTIDIISGGFPCQPFSQAGKRGGTSDDRYLWPEMLRIIREIRPSWIVGENVAGITSLAEPDGNVKLGHKTVTSNATSDLFEKVYIQQEVLLFGSILEDIEKERYNVQSFLIPASGVGASHQRYRVFIVANAASK